MTPSNINMDIPIDVSKIRYSKYFKNDKLLTRLITFYINDSFIFHRNENIDSNVILKNTDAVDGRSACYKINSYFQYRNLLYAIIKKGYFKKIGSIDSDTPSYAICDTNFREAIRQFQWNCLTYVSNNCEYKRSVKNLSQKGHVYNYYFSKDLHQLIGLTPLTEEFETKLGEIWPIWFAIAFRTGLLIIKSLCNYLERDQPDPSLVLAIENFIIDTLDLKLGLAPKLRAIINLELSERNDVLPWQTFFHEAKCDKYRCSYFCLAIVNYLLYNKDIKLPTFYDTLENEKRSKYDIHAGMTDEQRKEATIRFLQRSRIDKSRKKLTHKFTNFDHCISKPISLIIQNKFRYNSKNSTSSNKLPAKSGLVNPVDLKLQEKIVDNNSQKSTVNKLQSQISENIIISSSSLTKARESLEITSSQNIDSATENFGDRRSSMLNMDIITIDDSDKELTTNVKVEKNNEDDDIKIITSQIINSATENFGDQRPTVITIDDSDDESPKQNNKSDAITTEIFYTLMNNDILLRWDEIKDKYLIKFILNNPDDLQKDCTYKKLIMLEPQIFKGFKPENLRRRIDHLANSDEYLLKLCGSEKINTEEDKIVFKERIESLRKLMNISVKMELG